MFATRMLTTQPPKHAGTIVALARPARIVSARRARVRPWASSSATAKWLGMPLAWADATFQTMVTGPAVRKGADSSVISGRVVPSALTSRSERDDVTDVTAEARGAARPSIRAPSSPARARGTTARTHAARRSVCTVALILFMVIHPFLSAMSRQWRWAHNHTVATTLVCAAAGAMTRKNRQKHRQNG